MPGQRNLTVWHSQEMPASIEKLYLTSFPESERRPLDMLRHDIAAGRITLWLMSLRDSNQPVGFATVWELSHGDRAFSYIEHLAVDPAKRGTGIGSSFMKHMCGSGTVVLEVEPPHDPIALRRIGFYRSNGLTLHERFQYIQPPYAEGLPAVPLMLMATPDIQDEELPGIASVIHSTVYGV